MIEILAVDGVPISELIEESKSLDAYTQGKLDGWKEGFKEGLREGVKNGYERTQKI